MTATCELCMPGSCFLMDEDEMEYVEGGWYRTGSLYYSSARTAYKDLNRWAWKLYVYGGATMIGAAMAGAYVGGPIGACIGAVGGIIGASILWGMASACSDGAAKAYRLGYRSCRVTYTLCNFNLSVSVK